ncbi:type IV secretion system protein VirB6 [Altererythrobacter atlanticus]|uniref:Type IV secretion system protein VirB6 n=1 Tax=Croceibacterium atlanticum TaxID=1267766 RepID=A0A0F7KXI7_9SPHN|nr:type IV secretion system protein [Croceibacterium atlanticum]AKH43936.1 Type IV secretion system protein VirB6 [Croceibacterium atlanticum]MBB5733614.1 type IV secretion system protein VirB6 [Croceibacterium atlanticum]
MNSAACQQALDNVGSGVAASLRAVDCAATATAQAAFGRLFGTDGTLMPVLTILLTIFIAFFGFMLITGRSRIGIATLTPRMVTLGLVVTFATSWAAYQSVFWNLFASAPDWIASLLMGAEGSAVDIFAQKIDFVFAALIEASGPQAMQQGAASTFSPPGLLWVGGTLLLLGTVGLLAVCKIALAVLLALGPVFVVLALFDGTRGLFVGWLKGAAMLAMTPLFAVLGGSLMLELSVPVVGALSQVPGEIDPRAAMAFFMIGAIHCALMVMVLKVAGTMVSGWTVFGLARSIDDSAGSGSISTARGPAPAVSPLTARADQSRNSPSPSRQIRIAGAAPVAANDTGAATTIRRETTILSGSGAATGGHSAAGPSRARGIGSRFRNAPARPLEKLK